MKLRKMLMAFLLVFALVLVGCNDNAEVDESSVEESVDASVEESSVAETTETESSEDASVEESEAESAEESEEESTDDGEAAGQIEAGTYEGEGQGYVSTIKVEVDVEEDGTITDIRVLEHGDTERMVEFAENIIPVMIEHQSTKVDTYSGATFSSFGIIRATEAALEEAGADLSKYNVEMEAPVAEELDDVTTDIVVVGGGASGLSAAIEVKHQNPDINVIVLEKMPYTGGSLALSGGLFWTGNGSKYTPDDDFTPDSLVEWFTMRSEGPINEPYVRHIAEKAPIQFDYLMEQGAPWDYENPTETYPDSGIYRFETNVGMTDGKYRSAAAGSIASDWLAEFAAEQGAEIRVNSPVVELLTDDAGAVIGVRVESETELYNVFAKKVIMATGGFGNSREHLEMYAEDSAAKWPFLHAGNTGDGHDMMTDLGATIVGNGVMAYEALTPTLGYKGNVGSLVWVPELVVNIEGKRFVDETGQSTDIALQTYLQTDDIAFGIIDSRTDRNEDLEQGVSEGLIHKAETLEELAETLEITDVDAFLTTVENYNAAANDGAEDEFNADPELMKAVEEGPFYAVPLKSVIIGTMPGVEVDQDGRVLGAEGQPIPNLFAAGEVMFGNIFNRVYPATGTAIAQAIYSGAIAAEAAVNEIQE